ncbi:MBL fold metallo-hydrolase [Massilia sp. Leaf139]|uniref:MBL fold metallo-hydrolase n=1 Tax=Massilia sp. Leaf139 TaxID=1736272 RepID=UPI0006F44AF5|nr:MBL fold metallo-hydrolase [Massilia sp. Leaf139]KQQ88510.1 Zn-dependent hydrolase [Massilia sp. Leaf139]
MNPLEAQLAYPFADELPAPGSVREVARGLGWLRMPLPFALDHINLWLLKDEREGRSGYTVIDCGVATDATRANWEQVLTGPMDKQPVLRVLATHCHPDHVGLSGWLCARFKAPFWLTAGEFGFARMMAAALPGVDGPSAIPHFERHGLRDPAMLEQMRSRRNYYPSLVPSVPDAYTRLQDGQQIAIGDVGWRVITGFGHSPEHASLYSEALNVLISGDMVLPRISTNVSVFAVEPEGNPLQQYLDSLDKFAGLPDDVLVLPSHGKPFRGLHTRIAQLREHHVARLAEVREACRVPVSAMDIVPIMFRRPLDAHQLSFALGEALAHLHKLWNDGMLKRVTDVDGVFRFHLT